MSKHTPGPWVVRRAEGSETLDQICTDESEPWIIADVSGPERALPVEANARLIAAAPDLLEALQELFEDAVTYDFPSGLLEKARAAIKAETSD